MTVARFMLAVCAAALLALPAEAQRSKQPSKQQTTAAKAAEAKAAAFEAFAKQYEDKGFNRETVQLLFAIQVDRATYDRVQKKNNHSDQKMLQAARDTRDLGLTGRQNLDDVSNSTREEIAELKHHAQGLPAAKSSKGERRK